MNRKGFTLLELIIVMIVIGILATLTITFIFDDANAASFTTKPTAAANANTNQ